MPLLLSSLVVVILLAASPFTTLLLKPKATDTFVPLPTHAAAVISLFLFMIAFLLTRAMVGKVAHANSSKAPNVTAVAKVVTAATLAFAGGIAAIGGVMFPGGFTATKLNAMESVFSLALAMAGVLAATAAIIIIVHRVLRKTVSEEVAEAVIATATAIATVAVAGIVIVLVFLILFFRIMEAIAIIGGLFLLLGVITFAVLGPFFPSAADTRKRIRKTAD